jgi:GPH family glycoside/pentoside/hexuronide:cation symporter
MAMILAVVSVIPILLTFATVRERPEFQALPQPTLRDALHLVTTNKAFLIAAGVYLLTWMPIDLIQFVLVFLIRDYFGLGGAERDLIFLLLFGVAVLALPLWVRAAARWDKVRAYQVGIAFLAGVLILLSFTPPGRSTIVFILAALAGIGLSAAHVIPLAILPDCMDWDELRRNERNEGAYYSVVTLIQKMVGALTIALTGTLLTLSGYVAAVDGPASQPTSALSAIRWLTGPLPAVIFVLGIVLVSFYPITRQRHARILAALERKRTMRRRAEFEAVE